MPTGPSRAKMSNCHFATKRQTVRAFFQSTGEEEHPCPTCALLLPTRSGRIVNHRVGSTRAYSYPCIGSGYDIRTDQ
jgi:hypothetical protein